MRDPCRGWTGKPERPIAGPRSRRRLLRPPRPLQRGSPPCSTSNGSRENPEAFDAGLKRRGLQPGGDIKFSAELLVLDEARRKIVTDLQEAQARRNAASKEIGKAKAAKDEAKAAALMAEVASLNDVMAAGEDAQRAADEALSKALAVIPNLPRAEVPEGTDEHGNVEQRKVGTPPALGGINQPKQHFEIGEALGLMDFETAAKLSGSRFVVLKGALAEHGAWGSAPSCSTSTRKSSATPRSRLRSW